MIIGCDVVPIEVNGIGFGVVVETRYGVVDNAVTPPDTALVLTGEQNETYTGRRRRRRRRKQPNGQEWARCQRQQQCVRYAPVAAAGGSQRTYPSTNSICIAYGRLNVAVYQCQDVAVAPVTPVLTVSEPPNVITNLPVVSNITVHCDPDVPVDNT